VASLIVNLTINLTIFELAETLTGVNVEVPNYLEDSPGLILTGAFVPFGTETKPGQVIKGRNKCGGSILVFDPDDAEATVKPFAWGLRNTIGIAWNKADEMFVVVNGYDNAPARPIRMSMTELIV
jgi:hypothetical protein